MPQSKLTRDIIVIGASLGGMDALKALFAQLPPDLPAAILVVWHMPAGAPGFLPNILQRMTSFPVAVATDGEALSTGRAIIAPPDFHLVLQKSKNAGEVKIRLTHGPKENRFRPSIDVLFRSAAVACGPRVTGVILTGALDDGASGMYAVKECGGLAVVQDPLDAECPNMPINAMRAVTVDHVVPLSQMGEVLVGIVNGTTPNTKKPGEWPVTERPAPETMEKEVQIALEDNGLKSGVPEMGEPSTYACPECHGVLMQIKEGNLTRFRCHTGHAYSYESLLAEANEATETALWNALRAIQEMEMLTSHLAGHLREIGDSEAADACLQKMGLAQNQANLVRQAVLENQTDGQKNLPFQDSSCHNGVL